VKDVISYLMISHIFDLDKRIKLSHNGLVFQLRS